MFFDYLSAESGFLVARFVNPQPQQTLLLESGIPINGIIICERYLILSQKFVLYIMQPGMEKNNMSKQTIEVALKSFDERYYKYRVDKTTLETFGKSVTKYINDIDDAVKDDESEEHIKSIINRFLRSEFYCDDNYDINTYRRADSSIKYKGILHAIIEAKKPKNKTEMAREDDINRKALWEIVFYYLTETRLTDGKKVKNNPDSEIRRLIITDSQDWIIINASDLDKICDGYLEQQFYKYQNNLLSFSNDTEKFYAMIEEYFSQIDITQKLDYLYFNIKEAYKHRGQWQYVYKVMLPAFLIKDGYKQLSKTHILNSKFYKELLYIMGLKEEKIDGKNQIVVDKTINNSLIGQIIPFLVDDKGYDGETATEHAFQLCIIWINRLLFIKLFEGQLLAFNGDEACYHILDNEKIGSFQDLQTLFFDVFGKKNRADEPFINQFSEIPYLNSSLFERYQIEQDDINIRVIKNVGVCVKQGSVLGKKIKTLPLLEYIFDFLNAYSFSAQLDVEGTVKTKTEIIDASVLGLIFEKINGYREGSFYTKGFVTEYICKETIEKSIIDKINDDFGWDANTIDDLKFRIDLGSRDQLNRINDIINSLKICDPAVGSGHFLVSAMNRIIAIKKDLGVLMKADNNGRFTEYDIAVIDDILCVFDGQGNEFRYDKNNALSQVIQKTLFNEKRTIIENCLFGVDINSNAVAICQLRLWIELLKNAYYENGVMETLPNIDINIKCGNSLVHKIRYEIGKKISSKSSDLSKKTIQEYKYAVKQYKAASDKNNKNEVKKVINRIRNNLHYECDQLQIVSENGKAVLTWQSETDKMFDFYSNAFEWAIEFPEVLNEEGVFLGFDCIIGNPPYIRVQELNHREVDYYKESYNTAWKRLDISTLFIELAYSLVNKKGRVTYITSNQFITAEYGRKIRAFILENKLIDKIVDFADLPVFDGALTYVSIFFMYKGSAKNEGLMVYKVPELPFIIPSDKQFFNISYSELSDEKWELEDKDTKVCLNKIRNATEFRLSKFANSWTGTITGKDELLMCDISEHLPVEDCMQISVVRAEGCSRYGKAVPTKRIFYPYKESGEETQLIFLGDLEKNYPLTYSFIMENEAELKERKDSRKTFGDRLGWYGLVRFGKLSRFKQTKIVSPGEVKHNKFCLDYSGSAFSCARVFSINLEDDSMDIRYLLALLNSKTVEFYLHKTSAVKAGGYYSYSSTALSEIPIVFSKDHEKDIVDLVDDIMNKQSCSEDSSIEEAKIDSIIYSMYGLDDHDIKVIEESW